MQRAQCQPVGRVLWLVHRIEPSVSVPIDIGTFPADTAIAEPDEDPEGL